MVNRSRNKSKQLVKDSYITELQRLNAIRDYNEWISKDGEYMQMYLLSATGWNHD